MKEIDIPRYVDSQYQVFFWEIDEIAPVVMLMGLGIMTDTLTYMFFAMFVFMKFFSKFKHHHLDGVLLHMAYWHGLLKLNRHFDSGLVRTFET